MLLNMLEFPAYALWGPTEHGLAIDVRFGPIDRWP